MANSNGTTFDSDAGQLIFLTVYLELSNTLMKTAFTTFSGVSLQFKKRRSQITFDESLTDYFSWKTSFVDLSSSTYINSTDNPDFLQDAASNFILSGEQNVHQQETVFASGL